MMTCPECGSVAAESLAECPTCGATLKASQEDVGPTENCSNCGELISSEAEACPACGLLDSPQPCTSHNDQSAKGQCIVCGNAVCDDCNQGGNVHFLCAKHCNVPISQGWAQVYTTSDDLEAQLIRDNLQAEGVDARVLSQKDHYSLPVDLGDLSPVRVLVPAYSYSDAAALIAEHTDSTGELRFGDDEPELPPLESQL